MAARAARPARAARATRGITYATVKRVGLALPGVEEGTAYGSPALKVKGKLLACIPVHRSAEPGSLAVRVSFEDRDYLLRAAPGAFYTKPHYEPHPCVLVRLRAISRNELKTLLEAGLGFVTRTSRRVR